MADSQYWASVPREELGAAMALRVERYYRHLEETGRIRVWQNAIRTYYSLDADGQWARSASVEYGGEQGELVLQRANHFRSLLEHVHVLATASRPAFQCRAVNTDYRSTQQATLGDGLLDFYLTEKGLEDAAKLCLEYALLLGEGWIYLGWDPNAGDPWMSESRPIPEHKGKMDSYKRDLAEWEARQIEAQEMGGILDEDAPAPDGIEFYDHVTHTGDVDVQVCGPIDVVRDVNDSSDELRWVILRRTENRWDLAASYPEHSLAIENAGEDLSKKVDLRQLNERSIGDRSDQTTVYHLFHDRTPALPQGRYAIMCADTILFDGPLPYDCIPVRRMEPAHELGTAFGYTRMWDCLPLQEGLNAALSTVSTNHDALGTANLHIKPGTGWDVANIDSMRVIECDETPTVLDLRSTDEVSYKLIELLQTNMETISGINSVARGEPQASLKSGSALALVHSMAMQYNSGVQQTYGNGLEWLGTQLLSVMRTYATTPRIIEIAGKRRTPAMREFTGDQIGAVRRVKVELGNALMNTVAGRRDTADKFFAGQAITPEQYLEIMATGRLDPVLEGPRAQRGLVDLENERLMTGEPVKALWTDNHALHISEHLVLLADPHIRMDNEMVSIITAHVQEHINFQAPPAPPQGPPGQMEGAPMPAPGDPQAGPVTAEVAGVTDGPQGEAVGAQLPSMPTNPVDGQPFDPNGGMQ